MKSKRFNFCMAILLALAFCFLPMSAGAEEDEDIWDGSVATSWFSIDPQDEDYEDVIHVSTGAQLAYIAQLVNGSQDDKERLLDRTILLDNNLDLSGYQWTPIGKAGNGSNRPYLGYCKPFLGTFDGQGHVIKYKISDTNIKGVIGYEGSDAPGVALFGAIGSVSTIQNLSVSAELPLSGYTGSAWIGGIAIVNYGVIKNCEVSGSIVGSGTSIVGGITALNCKLIDNCASSAIVSVFDSGAVGGIVGKNIYLASTSPTSPSTVRNCSLSTEGSVTLNRPTLDSSQDAWAAGGIAGVNEPLGIIEGASSRGKISAIGKNLLYAPVGGIAGVNRQAIIKNCFFDGTLQGNTMGGIVGQAINWSGTVESAPKNTLENNYANVVIEDTSEETYRVGGIVGAINSNSDIINCVSSGLLKLSNSATTNYESIGGIIGSHTGSGFYTIKNCVSTSNIVSLSSGTTYLGGIVGTSAGRPTVNNCVFLGEISAGSGTNYIGGIFGDCTSVSNNTATIIQYNLSLGTITTAGNNTYVGGLIGNKNPYWGPQPTFKDNHWLATSEINTGLKNSGNANAEEDTVNNLTKIASVTTSPAVAAILSPVLANLSGAPEEFTVTIYPTEATASAQVAGTWAKGNDHIAFNPENPTTERNVSVKPVALGDAVVSYDVTTGLFGNAMPNLAAKVYVNAVSVNIEDIPGVTAPVAGDTPVTEITATDQYTGTVEWAGELTQDSKFDYGKSYTATITLTAKPGFTFTGVPEDFFKVADATATNTENSGVVMAVFLATGTEPDTTAPTVTGVVPADDAENVAVSGSVVITFDEDMGTDQGTVSLVPASGNPIQAAFVEWTDDRTVVYSYSGLAHGTVYTIGISGFKDTSNNAMAAVTSGYSFTTASAPSATTYALTVSSGTGSGNYAEDEEVAITANTAPSGKVFDRWTVTGGGTFANASAASTTYTMPGNAATVTATYKDVQSNAGETPIIVEFDHDSYPATFTDTNVETQVNADNLVIIDDALPAELEDMTDFVEIDPISGVVTVVVDAITEVIGDDEGLSEAVDTDEEILPLPVFEAQVTEEGKTALVTFKTDLDASFHGKAAGDLIIVKLKNDGSAGEVPKAATFSGITAGRFFLTDEDGVAIANTHKINAATEYYIHVAIKDNGSDKFDWNAEPNDIADPLIVAVKKEETTIEPSKDTSVKAIWTETASGDKVEAVSNVITMPEGTISATLKELPIWIEPTNAKAVVKPAASGDKYDFNSPNDTRTFNVKAEDGATSRDFNLTVTVDSSTTFDGNLVGASDATYIKANWKTTATLYSDGRVAVEIAIPMTGTVLPETITADTSGFTKSSIGFFITDGDGNLKKDYMGVTKQSAAREARGASTPWVLNFYGTCPTETDYRSAKILSFSYWMPGVATPYVQKFGTGVSVAEGTDAEETSFDVTSDQEDVEDEEKDRHNPSSGGCDTSAAGSIAVILPVVLLAAKKRR